MCAETGTQKRKIYVNSIQKLQRFLTGVKPNFWETPHIGQRLYFIRQLLPLLFPLPLWEIQDSEEQPR